MGALMSKVMQQHRGRRSVLAIPPTGAPDSLSRARSSPSSRVHVPGSSTVRGCPTVTDGLDGELARLQDQGTGGMALLQRRANTRPAALRPSRRSLRVGRELGAAVARQGLRAAGPATGSVPGSAGWPASYGQSMRRFWAQCTPRAALLHVWQPARAARSARP
jgi:hypothetical protein